MNEDGIDSARAHVPARTPNPAPISTARAEHYTWGTACDGWHLVRAAGLSVIQERMPAGSSEVMHRHAFARQFFFVLSGELQIDAEGVVHALDVGVGLEIAPGMAHQSHNRSAAPVDFVVVSQPPSHGDKAVAD